MRSVPIPEELVEVLWGRVLARSVRYGSCLIWQGVANSGSGYGKQKVVVGGRQRSFYVHRIAYVAEYGEPGSGLVIDHLCRNSVCVEPRHLEAVTQRENVLRGYGVTAVHAEKMSCASGHGFTEKNTRWYKTKYGMGRACRKCEIVARKRKAVEKLKVRLATLESELEVVSSL